MSTTPTATEPKVLTPAPASVDGTLRQSGKWRRLVFIVAIIAVVGIATFFLWKALRPKNEAIVSGNGRIEATDIDIAAKIARRKPVTSYAPHLLSPHDSELRCDTICHPAAATTVLAS